MDRARLFADTQTVLRSAESWEDGLKRACQIASEHPAVYDDLEFWERAAAASFPFDTLVEWSRSALESLDMGIPQVMLVLDCGDAPDGFWLGECQIASAEYYADFEAYANSNIVVDGGEFERANIRIIRVLTHHLVSELDHPILSFPKFDWHGINGEFLWLSMASLAVCQPLRDPQFCTGILGSRSHIVIMGGFEEVFCHLGTVTAAGLANQ